MIAARHPRSNRSRRRKRRLASDRATRPMPRPGPSRHPPGRASSVRHSSHRRHLHRSRRPGRARCLLGSPARIRRSRATSRVSSRARSHRVSRLVLRKRPQRSPRRTLVPGVGTQAPGRRRRGLVHRKMRQARALARVIRARIHQRRGDHRASPRRGRGRRAHHLAVSGRRNHRGPGALPRLLQRRHAACRRPGLSPAQSSRRDRRAERCRNCLSRRTRSRISQSGWRMLPSSRGRASVRPRMRRSSESVRSDS